VSRGIPTESVEKARSGEDAEAATAQNRGFKPKNTGSRPSRPGFAPDPGLNAPLSQLRAEARGTRLSVRTPYTQLSKFLHIGLFSRGLRTVSPLSSAGESVSSTRAQAPTERRSTELRIVRTSSCPRLGQPARVPALVAARLPRSAAAARGPRVEAGGLNIAAASPCLCELPILWPEKTPGCPS
jgi:hypothetical protein